jgi:tetratricopeptide (TPR) repeat protein
MKNLIAITLSFLFLSTICNAQKPSKAEKKLYKQANKQLANEDYKEAQASYTKLTEMDAKNEVYHFEGGLSYYFSDFERAKGIPFFEASLQNSKEDTIPELYYYLGRSYHINGEYDKSKEAFNKFKPFIETDSRAGQELMKKAEYFVSVNERGSDFLAKKDENIVATNLGQNINSSYGEYAPVLKKDDNVLLFTSRRESSTSKKLDKDLLPYENVYIAKKVDGEWTIITDENEIQKYVPKNLNTKKHEAGVIYSSDGKTLYTYKNDLIWKSILEDGAWSKLEELDKNINTSKFNIPSVSISKDGNTLYFVSNRKNGLGGKDIYISHKTSEGLWGDAELMSESINTQLDEDSPFISEDGKTLYFSSKGHEGIGGYDIYRSRLVDGNWSAAENMGIPVNSASDDIYFIIDNIENNGFFASARDGGIGGMDIYQVCMNCPKTITNTINGLLVNTDDTPINDGEIIIKNVSSDSPIGTFQTKEGKFKMTTEKTGEQELMVEAPNYEKQIVYLDLPKVSSETDVKITLTQFDKDSNTYQILNLASEKLNINKSDTIKVEKVIVKIEDNINNNENGSGSAIGSYKELYSYNSNEFNTSNPNFIALIDKAIGQSTDGKISLDIESSASRVPTSIYTSNTKLALTRGEKAKQTIIETLKAKGIKIENINFSPIKAIVSGPKYNGDYKNTRKYGEFQYVEITIK